MIMTAFTTHCLRDERLNWLAWLLAVFMLCLATAATAQSGLQDSPQLKIERMDDGLWLSTQVNFELPVVVEDALLKGIPIFFVAHARLLRDRWYWINKTVASAQRRMRLSYQPLTRRWRLNIATGEAPDVSQGLALNQNFESLAEAMSNIRRISRWKIAELADIEPGIRHVVEFSFLLDVSQLPRPLQIGTLGQSDWLISRTATQTLELESGK